jgi:cardiolipin synthase A/B
MPIRRRLRKHLTLILASAFLLTSIPAFSGSVPIHLGMAPDNSRELLFATFKAAKTELVVNMYEFASIDIAQALIARIKEGVAVRILLEGEPYTKMTHLQRQIVASIRKAMLHEANPDSSFHVMWDGKDGESRRMNFDHAKYVVADQYRTWTSSENFGPTGHPAAGLVGNRGWSVVVDDATLAGKFLAVFEEDSSTEYDDVVDVLDGALPWDIPAEADKPEKKLIRTIAARPMRSGTAGRVALFTSPESLSRLLGVFEAAEQELRVEFMDLPSVWYQPEKHANRPGRRRRARGERPRAAQR